MNAFVDGVGMGLTAWMDFLCGDLEHLNEQKISTQKDSWERVGKAIKSSAERYHAVERDQA